MHRYRSIIIALCSACLLVILALVGWNTVANAAGTTYYINNSAGSGCSNASSGTSASAPWCDFTPVNNRTFGPGDKILLARGTTYNQQMTINGSGSATAWAEIGAYGEGARPQIIRNGVAADRGIRMNNPSYWKVSDLEIGYAGAGILVWFDTKLNEGLRFSNLYVHHNYGYYKDTANTDKLFFSAGIAFTGSFASMEPNEYAVRNVVLDTIEGTRNQDSISFDWQNGDSAGIGGVHQVVRDVTLTNLYLHDDDGAGMTPGCSDSLRLVNMSNVVVMNSILRNVAACYTDTGTAAVFFGRLQDVSFVNSMVTDTPNTGSPDMTGFDYEYRTERVHVRHNYIVNHAGAGLEFLDITTGLSSGDFSIDHLVSGNVFANNGQHYGGGAVAQIGDRSYTHNTPPTRPSGTIRDNLYHQPASGFTATMGGGSFSSFALANNQAIASFGDIYHAPAQFSGAQGTDSWSYQYRPSGGAWANLPSFGDQSWQAGASAGSPAIYRFEQTPGACANCDVARAWTAPHDGFVAVRGLLLKSHIEGGNGVVARITKNGARVWPVGGDQLIAYNERAGVESNLDSLFVQAGDVLRFEVGNNGNHDYDRTSWAPTVAYQSMQAGYRWEFNTTGSTEGWNAVSDATLYIANGINTIVSTGNDPYMQSADLLNIEAAQHPRILLRMKNETASTIGQIFFQTDADPVYSEAKSVAFTPLAYDTKYTVYVANMESNPNWSGTIRRLRIDPAAAPGPILIDYIRVISRHAWHFNMPGDTEGWVAAHDVSQSVAGGINNLTATGADPFLESAANLNIQAADWGYLRIRMKNHSSSTLGQVFFQTAGDTGFSEARSVHFYPIAADSGYTEYVVNMGANPNWMGTIKKLRLDPISAAGTVQIDSIALAGH